MERINIKPLSVNEAWKGRRYRSDKYKAYQILTKAHLPYLKVGNGKVRVNIVFGFSSSGSDIDNPLKPFLDCLQNRYKFNDNQIYELNVKKEIVSIGKEYIDFEIINLK